MSDWSLATLIMNFLFGKRITKIKFVDYKFKRSNIEKKLSFLNNMFSISFKNQRFSWSVQKKEKNVTSTLHFFCRNFFLLFLVNSISPSVTWHSFQASHGQVKPSFKRNKTSERENDAAMGSTQWIYKFLFS